MPNIVQKKTLDIYKEVKKICDENNICYFALGGTAIGAVRHKGFIPWDDDLDLVMPYDDYLRFIEIVKDRKSKIQLRQSELIDNSFSLFEKMHDTSTTFIEPYELNTPSAYKGIFVDIMPLFGLKTEKRNTIHNKICELLNHLHCKKKTSIDINYTPLRKLTWLLLRPINKILPIDFWYKLWIKICKTNNFYSSKYVGYLWFLSIGEKNIFKKKWFDSYIEMPFEDTTIRVPIGYDEILKRQFGDYMQLPPINERINHGGGIIDTEKPFLFYVNEFNKNGNLKKFL